MKRIKKANFRIFENVIIKFENIEWNTLNTLVIWKCINQRWLLVMNIDEWRVGD